MTPDKSIDLLRRLLSIGDVLVNDRRVQISDSAIRQLRADVSECRLHGEIVGYEATCLIECIAEIAFARSDKDSRRESRAICYVNSFSTFIRGDVASLEKAAL